MEDRPGGYRAKLEYLMGQAHLAHADVLERVPAGVRASLPVDATGVTQAIDILAAAVGIGALLDEHPPPGPETPDRDRVAELRAAYAAQERAVLLCAERLDAEQA